MSEQMDQAVSALNDRISGFSGSAKFVIPGQGAIVVDEGGARAGDEETAVTLTADADVFGAIMNGDMDPTSAFMTGKLTIDGDMGQAMALAQAMA